MKPSLETFGENLYHAFNEVKQLGDNITGKTCQEKRFQYLVQFANLSEAHKNLYEKYLIKYESLAKEIGIEIVQDRII